MRLTKLGHSGVRIEEGGVRVVIDPGAFSAEDSMEDADAILITHEHFDHVVPEELIAFAKANPEVQVWTPPALAEQLGDIGAQVHGVRHGETFHIGGVPVEVFGSEHALLHRDIPAVENVGYRVGGQVYHPGDSFTVPSGPTTVLLAPSGGPWLRVSELVDFVREVDPRQAYLVHDAVLTEAGQNVVTGALKRLAGEAYGREIINWRPGETAELS